MVGDPFTEVREAWLKIGAWVDQLHAVPKDAAVIEAQFGGFASTEEVDQLVEALASADDLATSLGSIAATKRAIADNGAYLTGDLPPHPGYPQTIWWAGQVGNAAQSLAATFDALRSRVAAGRVRPDEVKATACGPSGMTATAERAAQQSTRLAERIDEASSRITGCVRSLSGSQALTQAGLQRGKLRAAIAAARGKAGTEYETATGDRLDDPGELPELSHDQLRKGLLAHRRTERAAAEYRQLRDQVIEDSAELAELEGFLGDTAGLESAGNEAIRALARLGTAIRSVCREFSSAKDRIGDACSLATEEQLTDASWLQQTFDLKGFTDLAAAAERFVQNSLVEPPDPRGAS